MSSFLVALQILTIFPTPSPKKMELRFIGEGIRYFSLIGLALGCLLAAVAFLGSKVLPDIVVKAFLPCFLALLAGGSHLDGLMDTADGLGSRRDKERMLEIMKDSRVGAFGVIAACSIFLLKFTLLLSLPYKLQYMLLILMPAWGRWAFACGACLFPYARPDGLGKPFAQYSGWKEFFLTTSVAALATLLLFPSKGIFLALGVIGAILLLNSYISSKLDGLTGDTYGFACEIAEVVFLTLAVAILS